MKVYNAIIVSIVIFLLGLFITIHSYHLGLIYFGALVILEIISYVLVNKLREDFQWLITPKDEYPELSRDGLKKFFAHGFDPELGWVRKPNTSKEEIGKFGKTKYHIDASGSRKNPGHERDPQKISFYGDSFPFGRQVNDNETCQWYLSELTKANILNFSIGNYGLDQALLRLKREYQKNRTKIVVMAVVPSTIVRIMCMWKHYSEYGNTFAFKPRFILVNGKLKLIKNIINSKEKFFKYKQYLPKIRQYDYFYTTKFKQEMIQFPYFLSILSDPTRNTRLIYLVSSYKWFKKDKKSSTYPPPMRAIMEINLKLRYKLYKSNKYAVKLLEKIVEEFAEYGKHQKFIPVFLLMPQKDDLLFIRNKKRSYYGEFIKNIQSKIFTIDLTESLVNRKDLDDIYSDDNKYGGHFSAIGNKLIAEIIYQKLKEFGVI